MTSFSDIFLARQGKARQGKLLLDDMDSFHYIRLNIFYMDHFV
jgi:hypothetical protein